jgi:uncharacterized membrane protein YhhN
MYLILTGLAIAAFCGFLYQIWYCRRGPSAAKSIVKTTAIVMLAVVSFSMKAPIFLTAGLAFCAIGDFFLSRDGDRAFLIGLIAFALGHVFYIFLFAGLGDFSLLMQWPWAVFALAMIFVGSFMARVLWPVAGDLRIPVMVYITIIMCMGLSAISMTGQGITVAALGAGMFILSDVILSTELFLMRADHPMRRFSPLFVWLFYWMAQVAIFVGMAAETVNFRPI